MYCTQNILPFDATTVAAAAAVAAAAVDSNPVQAIMVILTERMNVRVFSF